MEAQGSESCLAWCLGLFSSNLQLSKHLGLGLGCRVYWVAVKELKLSYHNGNI